MTGPTTMEGVAITLGHIQETLVRVLALQERAATREEMKEGDANLLGKVTAVEAKTEAAHTMIRALQDANTATQSVVSAAKWIVGLGGGTLAAIILRYLLAAGG